MKIEHMGKVWYEVRKRFLWVFWATEQTSSFCMDGIGGDEPMEFTTIDEAEKYVDGIKRKVSLICEKSF